MKRDAQHTHIPLEHVYMHLFHVEPEPYPERNLEPSYICILYLVGKFLLQNLKPL